MKKTGVLLISVIFILILYMGFASAGTINVDINNGSCVTGTQIDPYSVVYCNIQDALDDAISGDTINVASGAYNESIIVNKTVTIIGAGNATIISPPQDQNGFLINSDSATIQDLKISLETSGVDAQAIRLEGANSVTILRNTIETTGDKGIGIWIGGIGYSNSNNLKIYENTITINDESTGIYAEGGAPAQSGWEIKSNTITANIGNPLELYDVSNSEVSNNTLTTTALGGSNVMWFSELSNLFNLKFKDNILDGSSGSEVAIGTDFRDAPLDPGNSVETSITTVTISGNSFSNWGSRALRLGKVNGDGTVTNVNVNYNKFLSTGEALRNFDASEVNAEYNYWGSCDGPSGNGTGSGSAVYGNVTFTPWLGICITNKTNVTCAFESNNISVSADLAGAEVLNAWVSYTINGINKNETYTSKSGDTYYFTIPSSDLAGNGGMNLTWNVYANDSLNEYNNSWKTFYVRKKTQLTTLPASPDGLNSWYVTEPLFTLTKDNDGGNIYYQWDSDDIFLYLAPFNLTDIPNPPPHSAGILDLNWWTDFDVCGNESTQTELFFVDLTNPIITNLQPANGSTTYNTKPTISAYIDEFWQSNSEINLGTVTMSVDGVPVSANVSTADTLDAIVEFNPNVDLASGLHNVSVYAEDNAGRSSEIEWSFEILSPEDFTLTVYSPENMIYENKRVPFNITTSLEVAEIEYVNYADNNPAFRRLCRNCDEYGNSRERTKSLKEGKNNITIRATYDGGLTKEENILAIVDTKAPKISKTLPAKNDFTNGSLFSVKYTEENCNALSINIVSPTHGAGGAGPCISGRNIEENIIQNLNSFNGEIINYTFTITDITGKSDSKTVENVKVDTTSPVINDLNYSIPPNRSRITITLNITEQNLDKVGYKDLNQNNPKFRTLCTKLEQGICEKKVSFSGDAPNILIQVLDKAGNSDEETIIL